MTVTVVVIGSSPDAPDYSKAENWAALPDREDAADRLPEDCDLVDAQADASVDVFFIHPTTYYRSYSGNADVTDNRLNEFTDDQTIMRQASAFNGSARVYAPRYRQASLHNFFKRDMSKSKKAFDMAYSDVRSAFEYYMANFNEGRPVIIAGHSQGSLHGKMLVSEFFDGTDIQDQLVAAYLIGYSVERDLYSFLPVCDSPDQTGCIVSFSTYGWEAEPRHQDYSNSICVNPISWKDNGGLADRAGHIGAVPRSFDRIDEAMVDCKCVNNILWITKPRERGYIMMGGKNYHMVDYSLFYMDIRSNAAERIAAYLRGNN